jgi:interferon gamma-inducible protein 30
MAARLHHFLPLAALLLLVGAGDVMAAGNGKVRVALYYESLCPSSVDFVVNHLAKIFKDGLLDAVDVTLVPYGNAKVHANGVISCQVGVLSSAAPDPFVCSSLLSFFLWLQ